MSVEHDMYAEYMNDTLSGLDELLHELGASKSTADFQKRLRELNQYMLENPDVFGKGTYYIDPKLIDNLDVIKSIEKVLAQQHSASKQSTKLFWWSIVIGFVLGIVGGLIVAWLTTLI